MRLTPQQRAHVIMTAACRIARDSGLAAVNHGSVAKRCTVETSPATVRHYYTTKTDLWLAVASWDPEMADQARELGLKI